MLLPYPCQKGWSNCNNSTHQTGIAAAPALATGIAKQPSDAENSDTVEVDQHF